MRLALNLGYAAGPADDGRVELAVEADRLGYAVVLGGRGLRLGLPTVLAWVAAQTERIDVGAAVMQIPARTPAMTAMTAATLDTLSGGRFRLGLGVSGPQVSEGWHGVRFAKPLGRTREYVDIVRMALRRETRALRRRALHAAAAGRPGQGAEAHRPPGARARSRSTSPRSGRRTWSWPARSPTAGSAIFFAPEHAELSLGPIAGRAAGRQGGGERPATGFDVVADRAGRWSSTTTSDGRAADAGARRTPRSTSAAWAAGEQNFYNALARRMGFDAGGRSEVQDLYLDRQLPGGRGGGAVRASSTPPA